jgi:hypothetical protein
VDRFVSLGRGHCQYARILSDLSSLYLKDTGAATRMSSCLRYIGKSRPVICIGDFLSGVLAETELENLAHGQRQVHALAITTTGDVVLPGFGPAELRDVESGSLLTISSITDAKIKAASTFASHFEGLRSLCALHNIQFTRCQSDEQWQEILQRHFLKKNFGNARI